MSADEHSVQAAGSLLVDIGADRIVIDMVGGGSWQLPIGVDDLLDGPLERADRPRPEHLTNALGAVADHLEDVIIESAIVASAPAVGFVGPRAEMAGRVELGADELPASYVLTREDADEVFRTIVNEPSAERAHNPGLAADHVESIIATYCVILAVLRRLDLHEATLTADAAHLEGSG